MQNSRHSIYGGNYMSLTVHTVDIHSDEQIQMFNCDTSQIIYSFFLSNPKKYNSNSHFGGQSTQ